MSSRIENTPGHGCSIATRAVLLHGRGLITFSAVTNIENTANTQLYEILKPLASENSRQNTFEFHSSPLLHLV